MKNNTEQYKCQSYYDNNNELRDCTCGKCKVDELLTEYYNLVSEHGADYSSLDKDVITRWLRETLQSLIVDKNN